MQKLMMGTAAIALTAVMGAGPAEAATVRPATAKPSAQDTTWMRSNAQTNLAEIAIGKLAMARSHNADLRKVAKVTMDNHETVLAKLKVLAKKEGVTLPAAPNASQQKDAKELGSLAGSKFDLAWDDIQITGHKLSIAQTETEISKGSAPAVISFAKYYLPIAKMHLSMVEKLHHQLT
jgi:putative membrane protein